MIHFGFGRVEHLQKLINSVLWVLQVVLYNTYLALAMVQLNRQVRGSPKMMSSSKKVLRRNMKRRRQTISPEQFNKWPHTDPERFSLNALYGKDILPSKISNEFSVRSTSEKELCFHLT